MFLKIPSRDNATVVGALTKHVRKLPEQLRRSLTWDRGKEMADHKSFTVATNVQVYLRSTQPLAARQQREHQRFAATVFPAPGQ
jgi:IS30 family transposase